jgi:hypothetical protein
LRENRKAEEMANGTAGTPNQYRRYFDGQDTLDEALIREEFRPFVATRSAEQRDRKL